MRRVRLLESSDQLPASAGVIVNETSSDDSVATTTTSANSPKNLPTMPGRKAMGKNTTTSTSVMTMAARPISSRPLMAARTADSPISRWRSLFSKTTMESSTKMPVMSVMASSDTVSRVKLSSRMTMSVANSEVGIAMSTAAALRHERRKKIMTMATRMMPSTSVRVTPVSKDCVYADWSSTTASDAPGKRRSSDGSAAITLRAVSTSFGADRLLHREEEVGLAVDVRVDALGRVGVEHVGDVADAHAVGARDLQLGDGLRSVDVAADVDAGLALAP